MHWSVILIKNIAVFFASLGWPGLVGASIIAFVLFYWLIHHFLRRPGRLLDKVRQDPVPLIVGLCAAILVFYFFERKLIESGFHAEMVNAIVQFLLLIVLGGAVTALYQARLQKREDAERHRAERVAITERDKLTLMAMRDNLIAAYNRVKRVRRLLRARLEYPQGDDGPRLVPKSEYNQQMEQVIDAELEFESILRQIEGNVPLFGNDSRLDGCLDEIERHLTDTVKEFRRELRNFEGDPPRLNLEKLPKLERFLGLKSRDNATGEAPEKESKNHFRDQFRTAIRYLQKEINKLTRRINRTGSILWVADKWEKYIYEIKRLEEDGYEVKKARSTGDAVGLLDKGFNPMLIITNMGRTEDEIYNPTAGLELAKEVGGEKNDVYIYASYASVNRYREEVKPDVCKGIMDSRLRLLRTIDECAEEVERKALTTPGPEETVP